MVINPLILTDMANYTIEWLDEWGQVYETLEDCTIEEMRYHRQCAKQIHLCIRVTNETTGKVTRYDHLPAELYAER